MGFGRTGEQGEHTCQVSGDRVDLGHGVHPIRFEMDD